MFSNGYEVIFSHSHIISGSADCTVHLCSCDASGETTARLKCTNPTLTESTEAFQEREQSQYCILAATLQQLQQDPSEVHEEEDQDVVVILSLSPLLAAVTDGTTLVFYYVIMITFSDDEGFCLLSRP